MNTDSYIPKSALVLIMLLAVSGSAFAQEDSSTEHTVLVILKENLPVDHPLVQSYEVRGLEFDGKQLLRRGAGPVYGGSLTITGELELIQEFANAIQAYQKVHNVEITVHMIEASRAASKIDVPDSLNDVVDKLKETFGYPQFELLETVLIRGISGSPQGWEMSGIIPTSIRFREELGNDFSLLYTIGISAIELQNIDSERDISIERFQCAFQVPSLNAMVKGGESTYHLEYRDVGVSTALQLREGQQVVVGKSNVKSSSDALFIVVSAKVVD